jgi:DNA-binding beta-propeller fold protein YncE
MAASAADKFLYVGDPGTATNLAGAGYTIGASSITVTTTTGWPTPTGVVFGIDTV